MVAPSHRKPQSKEERLARLNAKLRLLDPQVPLHARERELLQKEIRLVKGQNTRPGASQKNKPPVRKKARIQNAKRKAATTSKEAAASDSSEHLGNMGSLGKLLTPKNFQESMNSITSLRGFFKQVSKYVQQADNLLDTLFVTANSLQESGVLKKLAESKGKKLGSSDLTNILMALMNSPLGNNIFKRIGSGDDAKTEEPSQTQTAAAPPAPPAAPSRPAGGPPALPPAPQRAAQAPQPPGAIRPGFPGAGPVH
ncbi:MAG: hypothetical protein ACYCVB_14115 [Bacilli bacterium]